MIFDCFTFFNELDLLDIRLHVLDEVVDKFVIVEGRKTYAGADKELVFEANRGRFAKFDNKIIYVVVDEYPEFKTSWTYENYQRNCIARGLKDCNPDDTILISDCDEIPNPHVVLKYAGKKGIKILEQYMFYYYINYLDVDSPIWFGGTRMLTYAEFLHALDGVRVKYNEYLPKELNSGTTANKIRLWKHAFHIADGGWHFSFLGGAKAIAEKIRAFSHQEFNLDKYLDLKSIQAKIDAGQDVFNRSGHKYRAVSIDESFPQWIQDNIGLYPSLFASNKMGRLSDYPMTHTAWWRLQEAFDIWRHMLRKE